MAGIYIHIPFCRSRCVYCGFYSTTHAHLIGRYVDALCREMQLRRTFLPAGTPISTIYLGGGTPSLLSADDLQRLFRVLCTHFAIDADAEVTLECNPDDVTPAWTAMLSTTPVNRVSMGAQTFHDGRLRFLRRRHHASQVAEAVMLLRQAGINNVSVDLMYGFPNQTLAEWEADVETALALSVEHLSAYALTYEPGTPLWQMLQAGQVSELDEELQRQMYFHLKDRLEAAGYEHYEISNFARPGRRSRHNSGYWNHTPYLGLGAAAHSFDGHRRRQWNVSNLQAYLQGVEQGNLDIDFEELDEPSVYNDLVMTALRTARGLSLLQLTPAQCSYALQQAAPYLACGWLSHADEHLRLTREGLFVSDTVMSALMMVAP